MTLTDWAALLDAAQAWARCNPEKKEQPQTVKGT